jgi:hypothetical protein
MYVVYVRKYCDDEREESQDFDGFTLSVPMMQKKWFLECCVCAYGPEWLDGFYSYSVFKSIHHRLVSGEHEHSNCKNRGPSQDSPKHKIYLTNSSNDFY